MIFKNRCYLEYKKSKLPKREITVPQMREGHLMTELNTARPLSLYGVRTSWGGLKWTHDRHPHSAHLGVWPEITHMCGSLFESSKYGSTFHRHLHKGTVPFWAPILRFSETQQMCSEFLWAINTWGSLGARVKSHLGTGSSVTVPSGLSSSLPQLCQFLSSGPKFLQFI